MKALLSIVHQWSSIESSSSIVEQRINPLKIYAANLLLVYRHFWLIFTKEIYIKIRKNLRGSCYKNLFADFIAWYIIQSSDRQNEIFSFRMPALFITWIYILDCKFQIAKNAFLLEDRYFATLLIHINLREEELQRKFGYKICAFSCVRRSYFSKLLWPPQDGYK